MSERKIGAGSLQAMGRLGLQELRNAMYSQSNVAAQTEKGMYGTATFSEVAEQRSAEPTEPASTAAPAAATPEPAAETSPGMASLRTPTAEPSAPAPTAESRGLDSLRAPAHEPSPPTPSAPERDDREPERE